MFKTCGQVVVKAANKTPATVGNKTHDFTRLFKTPNLSILFYTLACEFINNIRVLLFGSSKVKSNNLSSVSTGLIITISLNKELIGVVV